MTKLAEIKQRTDGHVTGPWYQTDDEDYTCVFKDYKDTRYTIAKAEDGWLECGANAALIAAAPDLMALCEQYDRELREAGEIVKLFMDEYANRYGIDGAYDDPMVRGRALLARHKENTDE